MRRTLNSEPAWLVVVDRTRADLYAWLRRQLGTHAEVIFDRRTEGPAAPRGDRRQPLTPAAASFWVQCGYVVVQRQPVARELAPLITPTFIAAIAARLTTPTLPASRARRIS